MKVPKIDKKFCKNADIWVILIPSQSVCKQYAKILSDISHYTCIGLDYLPTAIKYVDFWLSCQVGVFERCLRAGYLLNSHRVILPEENVSELKTPWFKNNANSDRQFVVEPYYVFKTTYDKPVIQENGKLFGDETGIIQAINFSLLNGAQSVILLGDADFDESTKHKIRMFEQYINIQHN